MADIRKRKGAKGVTYQVRYPSKTAKSGYAFASFRTLKEARDYTHHLGTLPEKRIYGVTTVPDAVEHWLDVCEKVGRDGRETVEPQTLVEYKRRARIIKEYLWPKNLQELEPADIVRFRTWLLQNKSRDLSRRTLSSFHSVLIEMKTQGYMKGDPAAGICIRSDGRYEESEVDIPSDQEIRDIYAAADFMATKNDYMKRRWARYRPMIYLAGFSGMRPSEIRGLPWSCLIDDQVKVMQRADATGIIGPVKSKAGRRTIYLPTLVTEMIRAWKEHCPHSDYDLVFPTDSGRPQLLHNFSQGAWVPLMREAGLIDGDNPQYTPYALRHYYASKLIEKGADLKFIQQTMGHSKIEITLNVYGHLIKNREASHKETAEQLARSVLQTSCGKSVAAAS